MSFTRRHLLVGSAAFAGTTILSTPMVLAQAKPKVVVIGGGAGGATAAKYIAKDSAGAIEVTLVEPLQTYQTCFHCNLFLGGFRDYKSITHNYKAVAKNTASRLCTSARPPSTATRRTVMLANGAKPALRPAGRLAGHRSEIRFRAGLVAGCGSRDAACAGSRARRRNCLKKRLDAVPNGGVIVMIAPPNPYRCPPGPYERVSMMAHALKAAKKDRCKIFVIDPKESFSKQALFQEGWEKHYKTMVEWLGPKVHSGMKSVDPKTGTVVTGFETYKNAALVNVIPAQMAGAIARDAKLANDSGYCAIDPASMKSAVDPNIFVLGDACIAGDMPKSAFSANSQAKVAAMVIRGELAAARTFPARYTNTCWSLIETDDCVKVGGAYEPKDGKIAASSTFVSKTEEPADLRKQTQAENMGWYAGITADMFG